MRFIFSITVSLAAIFAAGQTRACESYGAIGLEQRWETSAKDYWYSQSQGSRLMLDSWYRALQLGDTGTPFASRENLARYGFSFCDDDSVDPVGFVIDSDDVRAPAVGLNCAACHTGALYKDGQEFTVHGGQAMMDLQTFTQDLFTSTASTFREGAPSFNDGTATAGPKWAAFSQAVIGPDPSKEASDALYLELANWLQYRSKIQASIDEGGNWGHGRQDAVQVILNTMATLSGPRADDILPASSAPVSIPHVWNAPRSERVQWNGSAFKSRDIGLAGELSSGALIRNISEVIGVFGDIKLPDEDNLADIPFPSVETSVRLGNIVRMERALNVLSAPKWPDAFGTIDRTSEEYRAGADLYKTHCIECHSLVDPSKPLEPILDATETPVTSGPYVRLIPAFAMQGNSGITVDTDPMMACNALTHSSWTGKFAAYTNTFDAVKTFTTQGLSQVELKRFEPGTETLRLIEDISLRIVYEKRSELAKLQLDDLAGTSAVLFSSLLTGAVPVVGGNWIIGQNATEADSPRPSTHHLTTLEDVRAACAEIIAEQVKRDPTAVLPAYKAGPLAGIFASAPYLHNGSVPTVYDLLSPDMRPDTFEVGTVHYDTEKMGLGLARQTGATSTFIARNSDGSYTPGNANVGHAFPAEGLNGTEKKQIITYLKGL